MSYDGEGSSLVGVRKNCFQEPGLWSIGKYNLSFWRIFPLLHTWNPAWDKTLIKKSLEQSQIGIKMARSKGHPEEAVRVHIRRAYLHDSQGQQGF